MTRRKSRRKRRRHPHRGPNPHLYGSDVKVQRDADGIVIRIPGLTFSQYGPTLCFGIVFTAFPVLFIFYLTTTRRPEPQAPLPILVLFAIAGLFIVRVGLREAASRTKISIQNGVLRYSRGRIFRSLKQTLSVDAIRSFEVVSARDDNYPDRHHLNLHLETPGSFRTVVENRPREELEWIADLLRSRLPRLEPPKTEEEGEPASEGEAAASQSPLVHFPPGQTLDLEKEMEAAVVCSRCESVYRIDDHRLNCKNCGAPLVLKEEKGVGEHRQFMGSFARIESLVDITYKKRRDSEQIWYASNTPNAKERFKGPIECGWCDKFYEERPESANCARCGGVLPLPPSSEPGPKPPATPRVLPWGFTYRVFWRHNRLGAISAVMIVASLMMFAEHWLAGLGILAMGLGLGYLAFARRFRRYLALRRGRAVLGRIETVHASRSDLDLVPCRIYYRFDIDERPVRGVRWSIQHTISNHFVGQPVWVVYLDRHPICNDLWPPFN